MLARVAADFYWLGRHVERIEHTAGLLQFQLTRLVDRPADELAVGWQAIYQVLGQAPPGVATSGGEAETLLIADAYTLAGNLVEETANPDSLLSCWQRGRENAQLVRAQLPLAVWTCLNQGYLWIRDSNFALTWAKAPAALVRETIDRLRLLAGVVDATMSRDDAWRFLELGRFIERIQHQAGLIGCWIEFSREDRSDAALSWADLLRVCGAYETYCRRYSTRVDREEALGLLTRQPELPRSLRFSVQRIDEMLAGIDPVGAHHPLAPPHRMALRIAAAIEVEATRLSGAAESGGFFQSMEEHGRTLHDLTMASYVDHSLTEAVPS